MDLDPDEEDMGDVKLYNERERHWRIFFEDNDVGVYDKKLILHAKRWDVYINEKISADEGWVFCGSCWL